MSAPAPPRKTILGLGLKAGADPKSAQWTPEKVRAAMEAQMQAARDAGFELTPHLVEADPDRAVMESHVADVRALLAEREFDGVAIGYGLRDQADLTPMFQGFVNAVVEVPLAKGFKVPRMVFPLVPTEVLKALGEAFAE